MTLKEDLIFRGGTGRLLSNQAVIDYALLRELECRALAPMSLTWDYKNGIILGADDKSAPFSCLKSRIVKAGFTFFEGFLPLLILFIFITYFTTYQSPDILQTVVRRKAKRLHASHFKSSPNKHTSQVIYLHT